MTIIVVLYFQKILAAKTPQTSRLFGQLLKLTKIKLCSLSDLSLK